MFYYLEDSDFSIAIRFAQCGVQFLHKADLLADHNTWRTHPQRVPVALKRNLGEGYVVNIRRRD
ncbi:hypothetical protein BDP27DRAFT_1326536 [Rhodocollybia butyracea]|uniref:Uncharacterized protein n=1 Tax=Rhodocollybia butyracea TaxID=206335 RepID=A0A9P5PUG9_9AGAR|nr:hypothetical protein BDP27DRAFT_1326536 [Rhodocollybia butyracea]